MVFSSHLFIFYFLPVVLLVYYVSPRKVRHLGLTLFGYASHIYSDFSAYSDTAIGLGLLMGFMVAKNVDSPHQSASITEF